MEKIYGLVFLNIMLYLIFIINGKSTIEKVFLTAFIAFFFLASIPKIYSLGIALFLNAAAVLTGINSI